MRVETAAGPPLGAVHLVAGQEMRGVQEARDEFTRVVGHRPDTVWVADRVAFVTTLLQSFGVQSLTGLESCEVYGLTVEEDPSLSPGVLLLERLGV